MPKEHQITGLGPKQSDGSVEIFTVLPKPFNVTAAWLAEQSKAPAVGEVIEVSDTGALTLVTEAQAIADKADDEPNADGTQKKSHTSSFSGDGSGTSHFSTYRGRPIVVHAAEITAVGDLESDGSLVVTLTGGGTKTASPEMISRFVPSIGDYWVIVPQDGGNYEYLNPKAVFEGKYEAFANAPE